MKSVVMSTDLPLANKRTGKVRDLYDLTLADGSEGILIVASDRVSAFDVVLENGVPGKGVMLTKISSFWFDFFGSRFKHHLVSTDTEDIAGLTDEQRSSLKGRIMICRKTRVVPVECIVRGYLTGSGWKDYQKTGQVCGIDLPAGLLNGSKIEQPIFTPSTKADEGHDKNISFDEACEIGGRELMESIRDISLSLYQAARDHAAERGIILADTKFEFGQGTGSAGDATSASANFAKSAKTDAPILIDEIFTPDSSRFWPADEWEPGREQNSFDKQYVRNYLEGLVAEGKWDKQYPGPKLPEEVIFNTYQRYEEAFKRLTS